MIEILKASAGSGKTHQLTERYIRLLLETKDRYAYRHILAVTFTNKATDEMKSRILSELYKLATETSKSGYYKDFIGMFPDEKSLRDTAETVLCNILHDYSAFAVSTIDKFFQQTLKAFSRELGQFAAYQVELDRDALISECVGRVLDSLTVSKKDEKKLNWLTDNAIANLENGKGLNLEFSLTDIAKRLRSEEHRAKAESNGLDAEHLYDEAKVKALADGCKEVIKAFLDKLDAAVRAVDDAFAAAGMNEADTSSGFIAKEMAKFRGAKKDLAGCKALNDGAVPTKTFYDKCGDPQLWYAKAKLKEGYADRVTPEMAAAVASFPDVFENDYAVFRTAMLLKEQVYGFGLANDINRNFSEMLKEKNVLSLDDSNSILKGIIDGTDAPFIYEKMGVRFEHFLLDEFQDTSRIQWDNFKPLLENSVSQGAYNLVVGDVKQSIYRWRGSDWSLLNEEIARDFDVEEHPMEDNWRSSAEIVEFNNDFFRDTAEILDRKYSGEVGIISHIYSDVKQNPVPKNSVPGGVDVRFCGEDVPEEQAVLDIVNEALNQGFRYSDIGILVRNNSEGSDVASFLIENNVPVVTDDSLKILSAVTVRRMLSLLSSIDNPEDRMNIYLARQLDVTIPTEYHSLADLCEELLRMLKASDPETFNAETLYVQSFMDKVQDFQSKERDGLHAFLESMKEDKSSISSPSVGDSVRVMTIHKSKGLAFEYVIVPFIEKITLFKADKAWCKPSAEGTALEGAAQGIYDVNLSGKSENTLFENDYRDELLRQYVDNLNVAYVAFTRAKKQLRIVAAEPEKSFLDKVDLTPDTEVSNFAQILYRYSHKHKLSPKKSVGYVPEIEEDNFKTMESSYESWALDGRLTFSRDSSDFFSPEGETGASASNRIRGIVLHDILSDVVTQEDLGPAVKKAVEDGRLSASEGESALALLVEAVGGAATRGWFPDDPTRVWNEVTLIASDGELLRPDRVVETPDGALLVIDYKFGAHRKKYERQVSQYADMFRQMGYKNVSTYLWYVDSGKIL